MSEYIIYKKFCDDNCWAILNSKDIYFLKKWIYRFNRKKKRYGWIMGMMVKAIENVKGITKFENLLNIITHKN